MAVFGYSYFVTGSCRDAGESYTWYPENNVVCRYFLRGNCMFGTRCRYSHSEAREASGPSAAGPSELPMTGPSELPMAGPSELPMAGPSELPMAGPSELPMAGPSELPMAGPSELPMAGPSELPMAGPSELPMAVPTVVTDQAEEDNASGHTSQLEEMYPVNPPDTAGSVKDTAAWANAPEFIPSRDHTNGSQKSYAQAVHAEAGSSHMPDELPYEMPLCPLMEKNLECEYGENCGYIHGEICDICGHASLHPTDAEQRNKHQAICAVETERKIEVSKAISLSADKSCGICMELIMEKNAREQRFGILPNCNHCFCLKCIRKWRQAKQFENKIIRACPECRVTSDFVCPSMYWVSTKEEKETLIKDYKQALSVKNCKYFNVGQGKCPFGNKCFYLHAYPDGTKADVGPPVRQRRRNSEGDFGVLQQIILWDFLDERDNRWLFSNIDDLEDLVAILSDGSDDSDWSEYDVFFE